MNKKIYLIIMLVLCYTIGYASITNPELIGTFPTEGNANDVYVRGDYAYVADNQAGLRIVNISNPALPIIEGTCFIPGVNANGVYISGDYAYVTNGGFSIINITNPALPTIEGTYNTLFIDLSKKSICSSSSSNKSARAILFNVIDATV